MYLCRFSALIQRLLTTYYHFGRITIVFGRCICIVAFGKSSFSMPSLIGLIMLMGIASKNSILLVDYAIIARKEKDYSRFNALLDACHKRARPIIMTTLAMGAGMLPIALGIGTDQASVHQWQFQ